jgi:2-methyl-3-hydroxypyridine 5-carboxylic acid dioxygenase
LVALKVALGDVINLLCASFQVRRRGRTEINVAQTMRPAEIAGAGLSGLALAAALGQLGWRVVVHEAAAALRSGGGGLYISRDGFWALDQLGQGGAFRQRSFAPLGFETWIDGRLHRAHENHGVFRTALRHELHDLLATAAQAAGVEIRLGARVVGADPTGVLSLADGSRRSADLVVGADGVGSELFASLSLVRDRITHEDGIVRVLFDRRCLPGGNWDVSKDNWSYEVTPLRVLYSPCSPYHCYLVMMASAEDTVRLTAPPDFALWRPAFPHLDALFAREPIEARFDRYCSTRLSAWANGRAALIGDAAHAMPSSHGRGANISMRTAVKLAQSLASNDDIEVALAQWQAECRPEVAGDQREAEYLASSRSLHRGRPQIDLDQLVPANMKPGFDKKG